MKVFLRQSPPPDCSLVGGFDAPVPVVACRSTLDAVHAAARHHNPVPTCSAGSPVAYESSVNACRERFAEGNRTMLICRYFIRTLRTPRSYNLRQNTRSTSTPSSIQSSSYWPCQLKIEEGDLILRYGARDSPSLMFSMDNGCYRVVSREVRSCWSAEGGHCMSHSVR
jgi:hypothetical protein